MEIVQLARFSIFSLLLFSGCEMVHTNGEGDYRECNIYDEVAKELIVCPSFQTEIDIGEVDLDNNITIWFAGDVSSVEEFGNTILEIGEIEGDSNISHVVVTPVIAGSTKILIDEGEINISLTAVGLPIPVI